MNPIYFTHLNLLQLLHEVIPNASSLTPSAMAPRVSHHLPLPPIRVDGTYRQLASEVPPRRPHDVDADGVPPASMGGIASRVSALSRPRCASPCVRRLPRLPAPFSRRTRLSSANHPSRPTSIPSYRCHCHSPPLLPANVVESAMMRRRERTEVSHQQAIPQDIDLILTLPIRYAALLSANVVVVLRFSDDGRHR